MQRASTLSPPSGQRDIQHCGSVCRSYCIKDVFFRQFMCQTVSRVSQRTWVPSVFAVSSVKCTSINDS